MMAKNPSVCLEVCDNYQKQTYRNRCYVYGANGKLMLNIPIIHLRNGERQLTKNIRIEQSFNWQKQHLKSIKTAYQTSPYFEFYEDDFIAFFEGEYNNLLDLNIASLKLILDLLEYDVNITKTKEYKTFYDVDYRYLANAKTAHPFSFETYTQMFDEKYGFLPNLSILDLLFMEGPNALNYLENSVIEIR
ncbi:MAG: WbqC family protein [Flavobacteriaceae bacterium]|nr:WbqC family protein [Flavobacteriaceae bacterium]